MKKDLGKKKTITREEFLKAINLLESQICIEGFSQVLNWKQEIGFGRDEEATTK